MDFSVIFQALSYDLTFWLELLSMLACLIYLSWIFLQHSAEVESPRDYKMYRGLRKGREQVLSRFRSINRKLKVGAMISVKEVA